MKIAILIPSRNRPRMLSAVITALHEMESGENEVSYLVGYDKDDEATFGLSSQFEFPKVEFLQTPSDILTIGGIWNHLASDIAADIYSCMIDDAFPVSPHWDKTMVAMVKSGFQAFSWYEVSAPQNCGYPTFTKEWESKFPQGVLSEHYPFWFIDTCFAEMVHFIKNDGVPVHQQLSLFSKQEATQNLRELDFWWGFFNATRILRLKAAHAACEPNMSFEAFCESRQRFIDVASARDAEFRGEKIEQLEKERGVKTEPSQKYLLAKQLSQKYLEEHGLKPWAGLDK